MAENEILTYTITDPIEINLSYIPFLTEGGLFVPTIAPLMLGDRVLVDLVLPGKIDPMRIEGKVAWITPPNALHHVVPGVGVQFTGVNAQTTKTFIESQLDRSMDIGGYTYGISEDSRK